MASPRLPARVRSVICRVLLGVEWRRFWRSMLPSQLLCHGDGCVAATWMCRSGFYQKNEMPSSEIHLYSITLLLGGILGWVHQNPASPFASDFYCGRGYRRELRSEDHFYPFSSQKKSLFASDFLRSGNRASFGQDFYQTYARITFNQGFAQLFLGPFLALNTGK